MMVANKLLYLSLVICLISSNLLLVIVVTGVEADENSRRAGDKLREFEGELSNNGLTNDEGLEDEENEIIGHSANEFTWNHHRDDHGIYSGRSLMLSENIKPHQEQAEQEDEDELDEGTGRKSKLADDDPDPLKTIDYAEKEWNLMFRSFDLSYESLSSSILHELSKQTNLFQEIISRLDPKCQRDIYYTRDSIKKHKLWALRMIDSIGKLPSGITYGRFSSPGDYEECLSVRVDEHLYKDVKNNIVERHKFHGKYCLIDFRLPLPERPPDKLLSIHEPVLNFTDTEIGRKFPEMARNYSAYASVFYEVGYLHAFCLPSTCDVHDVTKSIGKALEGIYVIVNNTVDCEERPPDATVSLRKSQWIAIVFLFVVFANALVASVAHNLLPKEIRQGSGTEQRRASMRPPTAKQEDAGRESSKGEGLQNRIDRLNFLEEAKRLRIAHKDSSIKRLLSDLSLKYKFYADCFSIQRNFERLTKPDPRGLTFVHYTRIVAMALTVITHTGALGTLQAITKPADASNSEQIFRDLIPQMLANAFTSIQVFFFMAGFMLVISTFPSIKRDKGHISFMEYAVKRAIRLMPGLAATICLNFIWPLVVDGPMLRYFDRAIVEPCETNWWHTMAFLSNFDHVEKMCLRHSYFSASDYQLHIIAFPLLVLLYKQPSLSLFLASILTLSGFVAQVIMILTKLVVPFMMVDMVDKEAFFNVVHYLHHPVWNHMSAFFYGFLIGYLVVKQIRINLSETTIKRIWFVMMPVGAASIFAPYYWNHYKRPLHRWQMVLYVIFDRFILLSTCAWLSYATMVLARKPPAKRQPAPAKSVETPKQETRLENGQMGGVKSAIEQALTKGPPNTLASFDGGRLPVVTLQTESSPTNVTRLTLAAAHSRPPLTSLPRQRSSPNLENLQQQPQQQHQPTMLQPDPSRALNGGRLIRTVSGSNLATIAETSQTTGSAPLASGGGPVDELKDAPKVAAAAASTGGLPATQRPKSRGQAPVSNMNILCLVLSRLTFQLYLFNMVVLCVDVNHSKYFWFFSYYFIIIKAAAVYICSALMAMIFFVVLESPSLTLYIAWVKGRAAARARSTGHSPYGSDDAKKPGIVPQLAIMVSNEKQQQQQTTGTVSTNSQPNNRQPEAEGVELRTATKPTFSFIDLSSSSPAGSESASIHSQGEKATSMSQTKM
jgi:hypothetical protein